jgi:hypothetical protein
MTVKMSLRVQKKKKSMSQKKRLKMSQLSARSKSTLAKLTPWCQLNPPRKKRQLLIREMT